MEITEPNEGRAEVAVAPVLRERLGPMMCEIDFSNLAIKTEAFKDERNKYNMTITHGKTGLQVTGIGRKYKELYDCLCEELIDKVDPKMVEDCMDNAPTVRAIIRRTLDGSA